MNRKLASVQRVISVEPIENADSLEKVTVLGWHCVAKKGEYKAGDLCVYCEVDSILPDKPDFEFLRGRGFKIKTIKLRGQVSQGICFPLYIIPPNNYQEGDDVTEIMGVTKYEPIIPLSMTGQVEGYFPAFIPKTDEMRIQAVPNVLARHKGKEFYVTEKVDGCSITAWQMDGEFGVASRNLRYKESDSNIWWAAAKNIDLRDRMSSFDGYALQGEVLGNVQGNKYKFNKPTVYWFNAFNIKEHSYLNFSEFCNLISDMGLKTVPILGTIELNHSVDGLVEMAKGKSTLSDIHREGIVMRTVTDDVDIELGRLSFKVINPDFLLKYSE